MANEYAWDEQIDYLRQTKELFYNDDYIEFLVQKVWKIHSPVDIIDFGCGFGYLGLKLLPLLPEGSTYTGMDLGTKLLDEGRRLFDSLGYKVEFIQGDVQEFQPQRSYDIAVCHALLLHMPNPAVILDKMIGSVANGGMVVAFEPHWISASSNFYLHGHEQSRTVQLGFLQRLYEQDAARSGKDGNIGIKLPAYFGEAGLKDIGCRVTDKVNVLYPGMEEESKERLYSLFIDGGYADAPKGNQEAWIATLMERGASREEAERQYENELFLSKEFSKDSYAAYASNMKITFGRVSRLNE